MRKDWLLHIGDRVVDVADCRHTGRIERIVWSHTATVKWDDTGWRSIVPIADLRLAHAETTDEQVLRRLLRDCGESRGVA